jgi:hypothetical protein
MTAIARERDVIVLVKGDAIPVMVHDTLAASGWAGGQGVKWIDSTHDEFLVTKADGVYAGFLLWGSNESSDQFISAQENQVKYQFGTLCAGTWIIATPTFEKYTYASRQAGPLVPITYTIGQRLRFSLRGLFTSEDEWTLSGDPRGANGYFIASVAQLPTTITKFYMTIHTFI